MSRLRTPLMVSLSEPWGDPARARPLIESFPRGRSLLPHLEAAHRGLLDVQGGATAADAEIVACTARSVSLDRSFNAHARGIHGMLAGAVEIAPSPDFAAGCEQARAVLFPQGLAITKWKYAEKSGEAALIAARRTPALRATLAQIRLDEKVSLDDVVDRWIRAGHDLGANESLKRELERQRDIADEAAVKGRDVQQARQRWMRVARALLDDIALDNVAEDVAERIVGELKKALARAATTADAAADEGDLDTEPERAAPTPTDAKDDARAVVTPAAPANDTTPVPARKVG